MRPKSLRNAVLIYILRITYPVLEAAAMISGDFVRFQQFLHSPKAAGKPEN